jgi:uncharacterized DUF497 family protein
MRFTWDAEKAKANLRNHGISFAEAMEAFADPNADEDFDREHSDEEPRYDLIGFSSRRLLFVVFMEQEDGTFRIISARKAEKKQRVKYEKRKG